MAWKCVDVWTDLLAHFVNQLFVSFDSFDCWWKYRVLLSAENRGLSPSQAACAQNLCQNGGTCQQQGLTAICVCKPGFTGQRCESGELLIWKNFSAFLTKDICLFFVIKEYFRCQANGRFADASSCKQGRYFECVYFGQCMS